MHKPSVLIAEDDFIIREGLLRYLLETSFTIEAAVDSGDEVITAAKEH